MQTVKRLWRKAPDKHLALLDYRTTPLESVGLSPAQLLMGRRPRNNLPTACRLLAPTAYDPLKVKCLLDQTKDTQKHHHDLKKAGKPCIDLKPGDEVRMQPFPGSHTWTPAVVVRQHSAPRSFVVSSGDKQYRRTSQHLRHSTPAANCSRHWMQEEPWTEPPDHAASEKLSPTPSEQPHSPPRQRVSHGQAQPGELYITRRGRTVKPPNRLTL